MKKILLINLFVLTVVYSLGQSNVYHPFPDSNAVWVIDWSYYNGYHWVYEYYNLFVSGDTVIGNYSYHKLYKNGGLYQDHLNPSQSVSEYYHRYSGAFRQDSLNRKIYCYDDEDACDTLAYDFNLNVGDSLPLTYLYASYMNVISIDSILVGDHYNKRFWLGDNMCSNVSELIEGVGSSFGAFVFV